MARAGTRPIKVKYTWIAFPMNLNGFRLFEELDHETFFILQSANKIFEIFSCQILKTGLYDDFGMKITHAMVLGIETASYRLFWLYEIDSKMTGR